MIAGLVLVALVAAAGWAEGDAFVYVSGHYDGGGSSREVVLRTMSEADEVQVVVEAKVARGRFEVRLTDPRGHRIVGVGSGPDGRLQVDTGALRLVDGRPGEGEAPRGEWRLLIELAPGKGSYTVRYRGFTTVDARD